MKTSVPVSEDEYRAAVDNSLGWCSNCAEFTRECTEPDAEDYDCPLCESLSVVGAEQAMVLGLIDVMDVG